MTLRFTAVVSVTVTLAETLGTALLRACTVTVPPGGMASGAEYVVVSGVVCEFWMVPSAALPPTTPSTSQVTVWSCAPVTVAWKICDPASATVAGEGVTATLTAGTIATETDAAFDGSACGVTVICIAGGEGGKEGAVY